MAFTNAELNAALDALGPRWAYASLHTASPSTTGANEVSGGSPAYARIPIVWDPASGQVLGLNAPLVFNVPASTTVAYVGIWSALTGGTFRGSDQLSSSETFTAHGTYTLDSLNVTASST